MARQVKSVSIPERLQIKVAAIPNFTGWVIEALDNDTRSAEASNSFDRREVHLEDLEEIIHDLTMIQKDLKRIRTRYMTRQGNVHRHCDAVHAAIDGLIEGYRFSIDRAKR